MIASHVALVFVAVVMMAMPAVAQKNVAASVTGC